tara:strand:+ start:180 stop:374 length:195 start_codon:yes stop_codon:yes gene_type:complete
LFVIGWLKLTKLKLKCSKIFKHIYSFLNKYNEGHACINGKNNALVNIKNYFVIIPKEIRESNEV